MALLIIIRGPPGSGKTSVGNSLKHLLNLSSRTLQLDEIIPDVFDEKMTRQALESGRGTILDGSISYL